MEYWKGRYQMRRRQGASAIAAIIDAVFWPRPEVPFLSVRLHLRARKVMD